MAQDKSEKWQGKDEAELILKVARNTVFYAATGGGMVATAIFIGRSLWDVKKQVDKSK